MQTTAKRCGALAFGVNATKRPTFSSTECSVGSASSPSVLTAPLGHQSLHARRPSGFWAWLRMAKTRRTRKPRRACRRPTPSGAIADQYLRNAKQRLKPRTYSEIERYLLVSWKPLHPVSVFQITRRHISARIADFASVHGAVSAARARTALSSMFNWAIREGLDIAANPVLGTNRPAQPGSRERVLTETELSAIWQACGDDDYGRIVRLLLLTAQRRDEVGSMQWAELDTFSGLWTLPSARTKNHREHSLPLVPAALALLPHRRNGRDFLFGDGPRRSGDPHRGFSGWSKSKAALDARIAEAPGRTPAPLDSSRSSEIGVHGDGRPAWRVATHRGGDPKPRQRPPGWRCWCI